MNFAKQSGGPHWEVPLGRRDSKIANLKKANTNIPAPNSTIQNLITLFARQGLSEQDLVALSGELILQKSNHANDFLPLDEIDNAKSSDFSSCNRSAHHRDGKMCII